MHIKQQNRQRGRRDGRTGGGGVDKRERADGVLKRFRQDTCKTAFTTHQHRISIFQAPRSGEEEEEAGIKKKERRTGGGERSAWPGARNQPRVGRPPPRSEETEGNNAGGVAAKDRDSKTFSLALQKS